MSTSVPGLVFLREIERLNGRLIGVVDGLTAEELDRVPTAEANSIAVLISHAVAAQTADLHYAAGREFARVRESEFLVSGRTAAGLEAEVKAAAALVPGLVNEALAAGLDAVRRLPDRPGETNRTASVVYLLVRAVRHTTEHVGQVELTRQLLGKLSSPGRPRRGHASGSASG